MKDIMKEKLSQIIDFIKTKRNYIVTAFVVVVFACMSFSVSYGYFSSDASFTALKSKVVNFEEKEKSLKFYIETGYGTGVYVLSSTIPKTGYTFNSSKSTYSCANAANQSICTNMVMFLSADTNHYMETGVTGSLYFSAKADTTTNSDVELVVYKQGKGSGCGDSCDVYNKTSYTFHELATQGYYKKSISCTNGATVSEVDIDAGIIAVDTTKKTVCSLYMDYGNFASTILEDNSVITTSTTLAADSVATTYEGLLKVKDEFGDSYIFRGGQPNNYVSFGGYYWRILRINGNGTVRLVYWGTTTTRAAFSTMPYNTISSVNRENVGFYTNNNTSVSLVASLVESFYGSQLRSYQEQIADTVFCNDRSLYSDFNRTTLDNSATTGYYGKYNPNYPSKITHLTCDNKEDEFTVGKMYNTLSTKTGTNGESKETNVGNYDLRVPVGLITAAEYLLAGGGYTEEHPNSSFYLANIGWTMSPSTISISSNNFKEYYITSALFAQNLNSLASIHPVLSLKGDTIVTGSGTISDPYVPVTP